MSKQWLFNLLSILLMAVAFFFWGYSYVSMKTEVNNLKNDNQLLIDQMKAKEEASQLRQEEYQKLEDAYNELNQQMEDLKDEESRNWLAGSIPVNVDNTIPY